MSNSREESFVDFFRTAKPEIDVGVHQLMGGAIEDKWVHQPNKPWVLIGTQYQLLSRAATR